MTRSPNHQKSDSVRRKRSRMAQNKFPIHGLRYSHNSGYDDYKKEMDYLCGRVRDDERYIVDIRDGKSVSLKEVYFNYLKQLSRKIGETESSKKVVGDEEVAHPHELSEKIFQHYCQFEFVGLDRRLEKVVGFYNDELNFNKVNRRTSNSARKENSSEVVLLKAMKDALKNGVVEKITSLFNELSKKDESSGRLCVKNKADMFSILNREDHSLVKAFLEDFLNKNKDKIANAPTNFVLRAIKAELMLLKSDFILLGANNNYKDKNGTKISNVDMIDLESTALSAKTHDYYVKSRDKMLAFMKAKRVGGVNYIENNVIVDFDYSKMRFIPLQEDYNEASKYVLESATKQFGELFRSGTLSVVSKDPSTRKFISRLDDTVFDEMVSEAQYDVLRAIENAILSGGGKVKVRMATGSGKSHLLEEIVPRLFVKGDAFMTAVSPGKVFGDTEKKFPNRSINLSLNSSKDELERICQAEDLSRTLVVLDEEYFYHRNFYKLLEDRINGFRNIGSVGQRLIIEKEKNDFISNLEGKGAVVIISGASESLERIGYEKRRTDYKISKEKKEIEVHNKKSKIEEALNFTKKYNKSKKHSSYDKYLFGLVFSDIKPEEDVKEEAKSDFIIAEERRMHISQTENAKRHKPKGKKDKDIDAEYKTKEKEEERKKYIKDNLARLSSIEVGTDEFLLLDQKDREFIGRLRDAEAEKLEKQRTISSSSLSSEALVDVGKSTVSSKLLWDKGKGFVVDNNGVGITKKDFLIITAHYITELAAFDPESEKNCAKDYIEALSGLQSALVLSNNGALKRKSVGSASEKLDLNNIAEQAARIDGASLYKAMYNFIGNGHLQSLLGSYDKKSLGGDIIKGRLEYLQDRLATREYEYDDLSRRINETKDRFNVSNKQIVPDINVNSLVSKINDSGDNPSSSVLFQVVRDALDNQTSKLISGQKMQYILPDINIDDKTFGMQGARDILGEYADIVIVPHMDETNKVTKRAYYFDQQGNIKTFDTSRNNLREIVTSLKKLCICKLGDDPRVIDFFDIKDCIGGDSGQASIGIDKQYIQFTDSDCLSRDYDAVTWNLLMQFNRDRSDPDNKERIVNRKIILPQSCLRNATKKIARSDVSKFEVLRVDEGMYRRLADEYEESKKAILEDGSAEDKLKRIIEWNTKEDFYLHLIGLKQSKIGRDRKGGASVFESGIEEEVKIGNKGGNEVVLSPAVVESNGENLNRKPLNLSRLPNDYKEKNWTPVRRKETSYGSNRSEEKSNGGSFTPRDGKMVEDRSEENKENKRKLKVRLFEDQALTERYGPLSEEQAKELKDSSDDNEEGKEVDVILGCEEQAKELKDSSGDNEKGKEVDVILGCEEKKEDEASGGSFFTGDGKMEGGEPVKNEVDLNVDQALIEQDPLNEQQRKEFQGGSDGNKEGENKDKDKNKNKNKNKNKEVPHVGIDLDSLEEETSKGTPDTIPDTTPDTTLGGATAMSAKRDSIEYKYKVKKFTRPDKSYPSKSKIASQLAIYSGTYGSNNVNEEDANITNMIFDIIVKVADEKKFDKRQICGVLQYAIARGGVASGFDNPIYESFRDEDKKYHEDNLENYSNFVREFQIKCKGCGIFSYHIKEASGTKQGLRLCDIPKDVSDRVYKFIGEKNLLNNQTLYSKLLNDASEGINKKINQIRIFEENIGRGGQRDLL